MPTLSETRSQVSGIESGLKRLRQSQLMKQTEFKDMYSAIEQHHRDVRLAHLAGKPKDIIQQNDQDTQFFFILTKMLNEIQVPQQSLQKQKDTLQQVYAWYQGNKHVLHTKPRFGRNRRGTAATGEAKSILKNGFGRMQQEMQQAQIQVQQSGFDNSDAVGNISDSQVVGAPDDKPQVPSPMKAYRPDSLDHLLPKRKPYHPLSHLFNPHAQSTEYDDHQSMDSAEAIMAPVKLRVSQKDLRSHGLATVSEERTEHMHRWESFQQEQAYGQDLLGKMQHVGRSGVPQGIRYSAHERGLMPEEFTDDILVNYAQLNEQQTGDMTSSLDRSPPLLTRQGLEDFYELTEGHYPHKLPKYPSFKTRTKSAPPGERKLQASSAQGKRVVSAKSLQGKRCLSAVSRTTNATSDSGIKLDTVVNLIDSVTDELSCYKEKFAPEPQPGYRLPTVDLEASDAQETRALMGVLAEAERPQWDEYMEELNMEYNAEDGLPASSPGKEVIDWRGKVLPGTDQQKWKKSPFGNHSYVKKMTRAKSCKSSLRNAGSSSAGSRPKTAPTLSKSKWPSGKAAEMDDEAASKLMKVQHLGGSSRKNRRYFFNFGPERMSDTRSATPHAVGMEYLSFITPKLMSSSRGTNDARMHFESMERYYPEGMSPVPPHHSPSMGANIDGFLEGQLQHDVDSMVDEMDVPDLNDLDDDLQDLGDLEEQGEKDFAEHNLRASPRSEGGHSETDPSMTPKELLTDIQNLLKEQVVPVSSDAMSVDGRIPTVDVHEEKENGLEQPDRPLGPRKPRQHVAFIEKHETKPIGRLASSIHSRSSPRKSSTLTSPATMELTGVHFGVKPPGATSDSTKRPTVKPQSAPGSSRYVSHPEFFSLRRSSKIDLDGLGANGYPHCETDSASDATPTASVTSSPRQKTRLHMRAFPASKPATTPEINTTLSVQGLGRTTSQQHGAKPRARSAGSVPVRAKSASHKRMLQRQQEMLHKAPVTSQRTSPSIPSPHNPHGGRSAKVMQAYSTEMESHARKDRSPRHFMEKVGVLRQNNVTNVAASGYDFEESKDQPLTSSIQVIRVKFDQDDTETESPSAELEPQTIPGSEAADGMEEADHLQTSNSKQIHHICSPPEGQEVKTRPSSNKYSTNVGRPIPDYVEALDPKQYAAAVQLQKEAAAAVDIQRIFRGFIARNHYKYLQKEERERREDQRKAAIEIQRAFRGHLSRKKAIYNRKPDPEAVTWARDYKNAQAVLQQERQAKADSVTTMNMKNKARAEEKLAVIGPHVEIYDGFHPKQVGPSKFILVKAAIIIQKYVRRWLVQLFFAKLKRKGKEQAGSWSKMVKHYKDLVRRIQRRRGIEQPTAPFSYTDINDFMDTKKRYESVFERKSFGGELDIDELQAFFRECDLYPARSEINEAVHLVMRGRDLQKGHGLHRQDVLDIVFQLYPPKGSGIVVKRESTWMNPIVDGQEAMRLLGTEGVEPTDFKTCWKLTADSHRSRVEKLRLDKERQMEEEELAEARKQVAKREEAHEEREQELRAMVKERRMSRSSLRVSDLHDIQEVEEEEGTARRTRDGQNAADETMNDGEEQKL